MDGRVRLPQIGAVVAGERESLPWVVIDGADRPIPPVSSYLLDRMLGDVSPLTCRSYAFDLLRWYRVLWAVDRLCCAIPCGGGGGRGMIVCAVVVLSCGRGGGG
ncbi:hypothetical protein ACWCTE_36935, partial [Streptomyces sp. NPDC001774]